MPSEIKPDPPDDVTFVVNPPIEITRPIPDPSPDDLAATFLCGGCNVRGVWEHRCHADGRPCDCDTCEGRPCDCRDCREMRTLARCPICGGLDIGDQSHVRCM